MDKGEIIMAHFSQGENPGAPGKRLKRRKVTLPPWYRRGWKRPEPAEITGQTKVCIVGFHPSYRQTVPWGDPSWELWGCNGMYREVPIEYFTRWFEIHAVGQDLGQYGWREPQAELRLISSSVRLYTAGDERADTAAMKAEGLRPLVMSVPYPRERVAALTAHGDYHAGSFDYMVALAILEGFKHIRVCGIALSIGGSEPLSALPALMYWLGVAEGRGITVEVESGDAFRVFQLLRSDVRYGFDPFKLVVDAKPPRKP